MSTIHEYAELLKQRKLSSVELTKQYLARIEKADVQIGSYITVCSDDALAAAGKADERIARGEATLLTGIPVEEGEINDKIYIRNGWCCIGTWKGNNRRFARQTSQGERTQGGGTKA